MIVTVEPDDARGPGHAVIRVPGQAGADGGFRISRDPDWPEPNLGPAGWQGAEIALRPDAAERDGDDLLLRVGPAVCERLEQGIFFFALPAAGVSAPVMWPDIEAVHAGSGVMFARQPPAATAPIRTAETAGPLPVVPPPLITDPPHVPAPVRVRPGRSWLPVLLAALVVLVAVGGGWFWWLSRPGAPAPAPPHTEPAPAPPTPAPPAPPPADLDGMSVRDLIARNNTADMVDQARRRLAAKPADSLLLLETAGEDRHDGAALTLLAQLYDPNKPRQGGIPADPRQAAKDYREAERNGDHSGAADRDALHRSLIAARDGGDMQAKLIEGDFWP